jgi:hypothetical protein
MLKYITIKIILFFVLINISLSGCQKEGDSGGSRLETLFENNVLNRNFIVQLATNNGTDITANYSGYTFVLLKTDFYHGPLEAKKNGIVTTGSWSSNDDYSKLIITLPETPPEFVFLTRAWRFTAKSASVLKLAPWGSSEALVLHMSRQ